ncbi:MAG TPA: DUF4010 domain-containing protein [Alphaproteobacteria bacterium]|jgi:uncharacterized membrane protein (DUF4010 family)
MDPLDPFLRLGASLLIGFLIGFERGWRKRDDPEGSRPAGLRTFALIGLVGGVAGLLGETLGALVIAAGFIAVAGLAVATYFASVRADGRIGATTEFATVVAYALGALAGHGQIVLALAAALVTVALLDTKAPLHGLLQRIHHDELRSAIKLLLVSAVLLPILPDQAYGPGGVLNPHKLWWIVVLIAGLSLAGHFAQRFAGPSAGPILSGLFGGLVSSTALTMSAARLSLRAGALDASEAAAVAAAQAVMSVRILVVVGALNLPLVPMLLAPFGVAAAASMAAAYLLARRAGARRRGGDEDGNAGRGADRDAAKAPDDLGAAIVFAAVLAGVMLIAHYARAWLGPTGLYATAALAGLVDVDAITVTAATLAEAPASHIVGAILIAAAVNTLIKIGIAFSAGSRAFAGRVAVVIAAVLAAGAAGYAATLL